MHIAEIVKWTGEGRPPGLYKRWRRLGVELALFRISGCFCDFHSHFFFSNSKGPKSTVIRAIFCLGPPSLKILICLLSFRLWAPDAQFDLAKKRLFIYVRAPAPFTIQTWNFPFLVAFLNFKIQNDRNIQSYEQKFNMHMPRVLERMARAPSKRRACAFLRLWLLFLISKLKMTEIHGHLSIIFDAHCRNRKVDW